METRREAARDCRRDAVRRPARHAQPDGLSGQRIRVTPKFLLVPPAQETTAEKWLATIAAATAADVNPFSGSLSLVVEPRLASATRWYVTADPAEIDGLEFAYLAGGEGPQVESRIGLGCGRSRDPRDPRFWRGLHRLPRLVHERGGVMADLAQLKRGAMRCCGRAIPACASSRSTAGA